MDIKRELRRSRNELSIAGSGMIAFGFWTMIKTILILFTKKEEITGVVNESLDIAYSAQFVDECTRTLLSKVKGPSSAATTQSQIELANCRTDIIGLQDITRIWSSFHFLPKNLYTEKKRCSYLYRSKYRLICGPNGDLLADTVNLAKDMPLQSVGLAMHIMADTWAHSYFAGTPAGLQFCQI